MRDLNPRPLLCKSTALPTELIARLVRPLGARFLCLLSNVAYINLMSNKIDIIYEDSDCLVINKPAGLMVHPDGRSDGPFLTDWIVERYPDAANVGEPARGPDGAALNRAGIVHRLDRDTSGCLVIAKTVEGFSRLKAEFQDRVVSKKYLAFVWGELKEEFGTVNRPIGRNSNDFRKWSAQRGARGDLREAETYWTRLWTGREAATADGSAGEKFSLVEAEPKTGRTHQIRVHLLSIHHPIIGDTLYVPNRPMALGFNRQALHARSIEFEAPSGKRVKALAPLPTDFKAAYKALGIAMPL